MDKNLQYTTIHHIIRKKLGISLIEYCILDSIQRTQKNGFSYMTKAYLATWLWISERSVFDNIASLYEKDYIEKSSNWRLIKVRENVIDILLFWNSAEVADLWEQSMQKVQTKYANVADNNNIYNNKDKSLYNNINIIIDTFKKFLSSKGVEYDRQDERRWASNLSKNKDFLVIFPNVLMWIETIMPFVMEDDYWWNKLISLKMFYYKYPQIVNKMRQFGKIVSIDEKEKQKEREEIRRIAIDNM